VPLKGASVATGRKEGVRQGKADAFKGETEMSHETNGEYGETVGRKGKRVLKKGQNHWSVGESLPKGECVIGERELSSRELHKIKRKYRNKEDSWKGEWCRMGRGSH